ncbi:MAG: hypothetical protein ACP5SI_03630 [Chloroflexia bacterium]
MAQKLNREKIERELAQHLKSGETLLVFGYGSVGTKSCYIGLTDQRLLLNERTFRDEHKALEEIALADIAEVRLKKPFLFPLDLYLVWLLVKQRRLEIRTHSGRHLEIVLQKFPTIPGNETVAERIVAELQARVLGVVQAS